MRKKSAAVVSLMLASVLTLSACGSPTNNPNETKSTDDNVTTGDATKESNNVSDEQSAEAIKDLVTFESSNRELENFFIQNTEDARDLNVLCNAVSGLLETDAQGKLTPGLASEWGTDDEGLTWTFKLREGVKWVDVNGVEQAETTAQDFLTALEWIMNYHKNGANNISMPSTLIEGAADYYAYTQELSEEEAKALDASEGSKFLEMVGIEAPDDYTLIYHCTDKLPYFDTVATSACLYPLSQALIDKMGVDNMVGISNQDLWYNGPYTITEFISKNTKTLTKNPLYWDTEASLFDTVTIRIIEGADIGYQLYQTGELDHTNLNEADLNAIYNDESNPYHDQLVEKLPTKFSFQFHLNYNKNKEDGTPDENWNKAIANEAFRKSLYYGVDLTKYLARTNAIYPLHCENNAYTMKGLVYLSDGTEYTSLVEEKLGLGESDGETPKRLDADKAEELKQQAIKELTEQGVTFPIEIDHYIIAGSSAASLNATVLKECFEQSLGSDYVKVNIHTYTSSISKEVVTPRLQSFVITGWGADYGDLQNYLGQETYGEKTAYFSNNYSNANDITDEDLIATYEEFTKLVNEANAITDDTDARYEAYAEAEAYMLDHALVIPCSYEVTWQLTHVNDYTKSNAMYGIQNYMYKNWETSVDAYTTEQYDKFAEDFNNN